VMAMALFAATAASAGGPPIVNETEHFANEPDVFVDVNPCDPSQAVEVTSSDTGVIHFVAFADGTVHITGTVRSTFSVDVLPTDGTPDATGRGVTWFGQNGRIDPMVRARIPNGEVGARPGGAAAGCTATARAGAETSPATPDQTEELTIGKPAPDAAGSRSRGV